MFNAGFGTALEDMIRDPFVCNINNGVIQRRLLTMKLADALATVLLIEAADRSAQELQSAHDFNPVTVHAVARGKGDDRRTSQQPCYRCDGKHSLQNCRCKELICHTRKKQGHIARASQSMALSR